MDPYRAVISERARTGFAQALEGHPLLSVADLEADITQGVAYVWEGQTSDVFTRINGPVCEMGPASGDMNEIVAQALPDIERWAKENACTDMFVQAGREGWARVLAPHGYEVAAVILRKRLD